MLAETPQGPRKTFWRLRESRKGHLLHFDACGSSARAIFPILTLAEVPQTPRKDEAPGTRRVREPHHTACTRRIFCLGAVSA